MKNTSLVAVGLLISCIAFGQTNDEIKSLQYDTSQYSGLVVLPDKTKLKGYLVFNDNEGIVTLTNNAGQRSFNAKNIQSFEYYDLERQAKKSFYALEFYDTEARMPAVDFFEVLKEFESFAVLVRVHRLEAATKASATFGNPLTPGIGRSFVQTNNEPTRNIFQSRTVYFVDKDGNFQPYSRVTVRENPDDLILRNTKNSDILNGGLIEKYTNLHYAHLKKFAKAHKLKFNREDDLLAILNEYETVRDVPNLDVDRE
jgi:hypothetical protein